MPVNCCLRRILPIPLTQEFQYNLGRDNLKNLIIMTKFISFITILLCALCMYSCRESEEVIAYPEPPGLHQKPVTENENAKTADSLKVPDNHETDPPIKDGQDWRLESDTK